MQFVLPFEARSLEATPTEVAAVEPPLVEVVRNARARRYVIRVRPDGSVRVTIPRHGTKRDALLFARNQADWIARQRARVRAHVRRPVTWRVGRAIWLRGNLVRLSVTAEGAATYVWLDGRAVEIDDAAACLREPVHAHLRSLAERDLPPRVEALASRHGLDVMSVTVRDQRTRWGSCSTTGRISLNWRLVQMPDHVSDYVIVHELMHLQQANHSRKFWRLVEAAYPGFKEARAWLRRHGSELL